MEAWSNNNGQSAPLVLSGDKPRSAAVVTTWYSLISSLSSGPSVIVVKGSLQLKGTSARQATNDLAIGTERLILSTKESNHSARHNVLGDIVKRVMSVTLGA